MCLADEDSPSFLPDGFESLAGLFVDEPKLTEAFRTGWGVAWHEYDTRLFSGTEWFFRPSYNANLMSRWIPALEDVQDRLIRGASVADVVCGHGSSTIVMAKAFPKSTFHGFDYHAPSIERARRLAQDAGLDSQITFNVAGAKNYPGKGYDLRLP